MENNLDVALATHSLSKSDGGVKRVDDVSMTVRRGEIYGLIGKNGAGKTTLMRLILGVASPESGSIEIGGKSDSASLSAARAKCGSLVEQPAFYPGLTAKDNLRAYALATGQTAAIDDLLSLVGLADCDKKNVRNFSLGMKQRLAIAMALVGDPDLLLLDEPVNGLDPTGILQIRELLQRLNIERGTTILVSSHLLGELGRIATAYGVMRDGKLVAEMRGDELTSLARPRIRAVVADREKALAALKEHFREEDFTLRGNTAEIFRTGADVASVSAIFATANVPIMQISIASGDLESAFIDLM